jgi:type IV pilus assembly protein PilB
VGEIRDAETVDIAVNAALTGHLVLSTFHANDASSVVPRLLHMGIEPFLLASTLHLIIAQRLLRQICEKCRVSYSATGAALKAFQEVGKIKGVAVGSKATLYKGKGCSACNNTGFRGRVGIFEIIRVTPEMEEVILKNPASKEVWQLAKSQGGRSLYEDGLQKVFNGVTTFEELNRVVKVM